MVNTYRPHTADVCCFDWLDLAARLPPHSIDLLYADPPFNTGQPQEGPNGRYEDSWQDLPSYLAWLRERLEATLPALKPTASILLHLDFRTSHHARLLLDTLLGPDRFVNHLIWSYGLGGSSPRRFARKHDDILFYCFDPARYWFEPPMIPATSQRMKGLQKKATDVLDIPSINNMAAERTGYPTQKPLALLDMLVRACCPPGGIVLDPCCGSGTTLVAAALAGRGFIGGDISPQAVELARARVAGIAGPTP
jgi:site-specific DNA-methyltransferase (adenine-specific)